MTFVHTYKSRARNDIVHKSRARNDIVHESRARNDIVHKSRIRNDIMQEVEVQGSGSFRSAAGGQVLYPISVKIIINN